MLVLNWRYCCIAGESLAEVDGDAASGMNRGDYNTFNGSETNVEC